MKAINNINTIIKELREIAPRFIEVRPSLLKLSFKSFIITHLSFLTDKIKPLYDLFAGAKSNTIILRVQNQTQSFCRLRIILLSLIFLQAKD
jgi:hypothetical protein